ncbi:MAG TPA: WXG100 family type VII secretion target [Actinokineospora sp.]|nr:WXG100 family type VII secretion target [Actinokineospora sp.]
MIDLEQLVRRVKEQAEQAAAAKHAAAQERRRRREADDSYVNGGVNWNGYSLESLQRMVGDQANPNQLDMLADEWAKHGERIETAARDLSRSLNRLMRFWTGAASEGAARTVVSNAAWVAEMAGTAKQMADPIQDAGGALRSAQDTMPGKPSSAWYATAGGGAAAGFAIGGPVGAAFGAALGGIASAFGFGSNKKKLKRKAVQTMERFEAAVLGIDGATPRFGGPADGVNPGTGPNLGRPPSTGVPGPGVHVPGGPNHPGWTGAPPPNNNGGVNVDTTPSFAPGFNTGWEARWQGLTGFGAGSGNVGGPGAGGLNGFGSGALGGFGAGGLGAGRAGLGAGAGAGARSGALGAGGGRGTGRGGAGRFGRANGFGDAHGRGAGGYGAGAGSGKRGEDDGEHHRRVPIEEDPFAITDLKSAPPVIGL